MASLDLLERKLLKILAESNQVPLKRRKHYQVKRQETGDKMMSDAEKRELLQLFLHRIETLPEEKKQEVLELLRLYEQE